MIIEYSIYVSVEVEGGKRGRVGAGQRSKEEV